MQFRRRRRDDVAAVLGRPAVPVVTMPPAASMIGMSATMS